MDTMSNVAADTTANAADLETLSHTASLSSSIAVAVQVTNSAAAEVFALPELLEIILVHMSTFTKNVTSSWSLKTDEKTYKGPAKDLFVLQRVNSTFRATIAQNNIMQQCMFLEATPGPFVKGPKDSVRIDPFQWMLADIGIVGHDPNGNEEWELIGEPHILTSYYGFPEERTLCDNKLSAEASWRQMKLHRMKGMKPIEFKLDSREKLFNVAEFAEGDGMTLGKFYDGLQVLAPLLERVTNAQRDLDDGGDYDENNKPASRNQLKRRMRSARKNLIDEIIRKDLWT